MSGIAEALCRMGYQVSGSDMKLSANTNKLSSMGVNVFEGHHSDHINDSQVVIKSSAIPDNNPEIVSAKEKNIPIMKRAEIIADLMRSKKGIAIAGTHGKTTTTSLTATILQHAKKDPTYFIGGIVKNLNGHARVGKGDILLAEADESDGTFLLLNPIVNVVTNIDDDHLDHYETSEKIDSAFHRFINNVPFYGKTVLNIDSERVVKALKKTRRPYSTYSLIDSGATYYGKFVKNIEGGQQFELFFEGDSKGEFRTNLFGEHNLSNTLAAIAAAHEVGTGFDEIKKGLCEFQGVGRRFQILYKEKESLYIDDYAHHPTEIQITVKTARETYPNHRLVVFFEPHRFSRTKDQWQNYLHCFNGADEVNLLPIYAASEQPEPGIDSESLVKDINRIHPGLGKSLGERDFETFAHQSFGLNTVVLCMGAGSIGRRLNEMVKAKYETS